MEAIILDRIGKRADGYHGPTGHPALTSACRSVSSSSSSTHSTDDSFNRLKRRAISGEIATPSGTGACDMRSTGTGSDVVFAHADPNSGPCAVLSLDDDVPHRVDRGHFTIGAERSPAPTASVGRETSDYPPLSHPRSRASSIVRRRENSGSHSPPQPNSRQSPRIDSDNDAHGCATVYPLPLTNSRPTNGIDSLTSSSVRRRARCQTGDRSSRGNQSLRPTARTTPLRMTTPRHILRSCATSFALLRSRCHFTT